MVGGLWKILMLRLQNYFIVIIPFNFMQINIWRICFCIIFYTTALGRGFSPPDESRASESRLLYATLASCSHCSCSRVASIIYNVYIHNHAAYLCQTTFSSLVRQLILEINKHVNADCAYCNNSSITNDEHNVMHTCIIYVGGRLIAT